MTRLFEKKLGQLIVHYVQAMRETTHMRGLCCSPLMIRGDADEVR